jgi:DNA-binding transcriptional MerR regulator
MNKHQHPRPQYLSIGQFAATTQLSLKALRLYEQQGLLRPTVVDSASRYRYYHPEQVETAVLIRLMRQMEMPLSLIAQILQAENEDEASQMVWQYQEQFSQRAEQVRQISGVLLAQLNHKEMEMNQQPATEIRFVKLPAMRVASFHGQGTAPESVALDKLAAWAEPQGLLDDLSSYRLFGFNNPSPAPEDIPGQAEYGYEVWITVTPDVEPLGEAALRSFTGGLYAVTRVQGVENIGAGWQRLQAWHEGSGYEYGQQQWLEEHLTPVGGPLEELQLDLYFPLSEKS